jgi:hypothetical protein
MNESLFDVIPRINLGINAVIADVNSASTLS